MIRVTGHSISNSYLIQIKASKYIEVTVDFPLLNFPSIKLITLLNEGIIGRRSLVYVRHKIL